MNLCRGTSLPEHSIPGHTETSRRLNPVPAVTTCAVHFYRKSAAQVEYGEIIMRKRDKMEKVGKLIGSWRERREGRRKGGGGHRYKFEKRMTRTDICNKSLLSPH
jgi:hypothetical protein